MNELLDFYHGKRVFVTGHTGFKGSWLCTILTMAGAQVTGYALPPEGEESLFSMAAVDKQTDSHYGDIRDEEQLKKVFSGAKPELVFHLAAQPIVRASYRDPAATYSTNVMGTVFMLECLRGSNTVRSFVNVTTDKVYQNNEWVWGYRENEPLDGYDPYSNSKSCSELVTACYDRSFLKACGIAVSTARAGNAIGGGDFSPDRLVPDCARALSRGESVVLRNPHSVRPYQHVMELLYAYLLIAKRQWEDRSLSGSYNIGPSADDCLTNREIAQMFCRRWGDGARWESGSCDGPHEAAQLRLDAGKMRCVFGWKPVWNTERAVAESADWYKSVLLRHEDAAQITRSQITAFFAEA